MSRTTMTLSVLTAVIFAIMAIGTVTGSPRLVKRGYRTFDSTAPVQGLHLALSGPSSMRALWFNPTLFASSVFHPECNYGHGPTNLSYAINGTAYTYADDGFLETLNEAVMDLSQLLSDSHTRIYYRCGDSAYGWSSVTSFDYMSDQIVTNQPEFTSPDAKLIALVGDLAYRRSNDTIHSIKGFIDNGNAKLIVHAGDIAYADLLGSMYGAHYSKVWANYMQEMQPIASKVPYMTCPGNHEATSDFAAYRNWLKMPSRASHSNSPYWYSFDYMGVHFAMISTEHNVSQDSAQYRWLADDLSQTNGNRRNVPWIMVVAHSPLYCSSVIIGEDDCTHIAQTFRTHLEELLRQQRVDVFMNGHLHNYERTWPVLNGAIVHGKSYINPRAPIHITNGAGGAPLLNNPFMAPSEDTRAFHSNSFNSGYLLMQPLPHQLRFRYLESRDGRVIDDFVIVKESLNNGQIG